MQIPFHPVIIIIIIIIIIISIWGEKDEHTPDRPELSASRFICRLPASTTPQPCYYVSIHALSVAAFILLTPGALYSREQRNTVESSYFRRSRGRKEDSYEVRVGRSQLCTVIRLRIAIGLPLTGKCLSHLYRHASYGGVREVTDEQGESTKYFIHLSVPHLR